MKTNSEISLSWFISDMLRKEIENGKYEKGERMPSESSLCRRFQTNRYTIRQSLDRLVQIGLIRPQKGVGYFVSEKPLDLRYEVTPGTRYSEIIRKHGRKPKAMLVSKQQCIPSENAAEFLHLTAHEEAYKLEIVRFADDIPLTWSETWLPVKLFPDFLRQTDNFQSLYTIFEQAYGIYPERMHSTFQSNFSTAREASFLQISANTPLLQIESVMCDQSKRPVEYTIAKYRGDLCRVSVQF